MGHRLRFHRATAKEIKGPKPVAVEIARSAFPKIAIIYNDAPAGERAVGLLANLFCEPEERAALRPILWRCDFLEDPDWFALSLADGVDADVIIVSTSSPGALPQPLENWIERCCAQKQGASAALVALFGASEAMDTPDSARLELIRNAASRAGLEFFAPGAGMERLPPLNFTQCGRLGKNVWIGSRMP